MSRRARKTVDVAYILGEANAQLRRHDSEYGNFNADTRRGVALLLENILFETGNYHGFNSVGWIDEGGCERWRADGEPEDTGPYSGDDTRRRYY